MKLTAEEIEKGNQIIAKFMSSKKDDRFYFIPFVKSNNKTGWVSIPNMAFHESWDWLMPVIEKISYKLFDDGDTCYPRTFGMVCKDDVMPMFAFNRFPLHKEVSLIHAAFDACVEYIEWHNNQK